RRREGRPNPYKVKRNLPLCGPLLRDRALADLLELFACSDGRRASRRRAGARGPSGPEYLIRPCEHRIGLARAVALPWVASAYEPQSAHTERTNKPATSASPIRFRRIDLHRLYGEIAAS